MSNFLNSMTSKGQSQRKTTPEQLVRLTQRALVDMFDEDFDNSTTSTNKSGSIPPSELCSRLSQLKVILYGGTSDGDKPEVDEDRAEEVSRRIQEEGLMLQLIDKLAEIPFEARKDTAQIFNNLMHKNISNFVTYISDHFYIVKKIANGYANNDIALNCGTMLRECVRCEELIRQILQPEDTFLWLFFDTFVHLPNFDVASDAFNTLRDILVSSRNKQVATDFLEHRYTDVFKKYEVLLESGNYVTRRRSLKLLGELLLDRSNFNVMMRFIAAEHNLQVVMNLLRDKSANIQFEAFHVFKVFVANPNKPAKIRLILYNNKQKLCTYLTNFHQDKEEDDSQFSEEKKLLIATLHALERPSSDEIRQEMQSNVKESTTSKDETTRSTSTSSSSSSSSSSAISSSQTNEQVKQSKGYLREALENSTVGSGVDTVRTDVLLDESDIQPIGNQLPGLVISDSNSKPHASQSSGDGSTSS